MNKRILGGLAAAVMLTGGLAFSTAGTASAASLVDVEWTEALNQESYWEIYFANDTRTVSCTKTENVSGLIGAEFDAAVTKKGASVVRVYADLTQTGEFTATHPQGEPPMSWVMKCNFTPIPSGLIDPPVLTASFECVADSASSLLNPVSSTKWTAGPITEDKSTDTFTVEITPAEGSQFADSEGSITLTAEYIEISDCEATVAVPSLTPPSCQAAGGVVAVNTAKYTFGNVGNNYTATAVAGVRLVGQTVFGMQPLPKLNTGCSEVTQSEPPIAPVAPAIRPAPDAVAAFSPAQAPPAEVSALPSVLPAQALPSTGIDGTGITAIIALLLTSLGGAALFAARRRDASI